MRATSTGATGNYKYIHSRTLIFIKFKVFCDWTLSSETRYSIKFSTYSYIIILTSFIFDFPFACDLAGERKWKKSCEMTLTSLKRSF